MPAQSAGIMVYRKREGRVEILLAHNGGPFFARKDEGWWTIPKGLIEENEDGLAAAKREFEEETGLPAPNGEYLPLGTVKQVNNKIVHAWAVEGDVDPRIMKSNTFEMEWPPKSGKKQEFPEIDRCEWFVPAVARKKANKAQSELVDRLLEKLGIQDDSGEQTSLL